MSQREQIVTFKTMVPVEYNKRLDALAETSAIILPRMLANRREASSRFYKEVPCVIAKGLVSKYQRNLKCKHVTRLCLPVCGDKGRQVKLVEGGIRVPAIFKKAVLNCQFPLPVIGFIRHVEFYKRAGRWFMSCSYNTLCAELIKPISVVGVDRNSVGNIATLAEPNSGDIRFVGFNADRWKTNFRNRKARIMSQGRKRLVSRLRRKQSRRTKYENHRTAKTIVAFAASHRSAIALENLKLIKGAKRSAEKRQWAHNQLEQFIQYKAALCGVPIVLVNPAYTSQDCSRCGSRNKPNGKSYTCSHCGSKSHRDINAAFNIAALGAASLGIVSGLKVLLTGRIGAPLSGKEQAIHA